MKPFHRWLITNGLMLATLIVGLCGVAGAWNIIVFGLWLYFISVLACMWTKAHIPKVEGLPRWLDVGYDVLFAGLLVWNGHWVLGLVFTLTMLFSKTLHHNPKTE